MSLSQYYLSRSSDIPLYMQLASWLAAEIQQGKWKSYDCLPSESDLIKCFSVSRVTVRKAIKVLVDRGIAYTRQGKGVYVRGPGVYQDLGPLRGFYDGLVQQGVTPITEIVEFTANRKVRSGLCANEFQMALQYVRSFTLDGMEIALADVTVFTYDIEITREQVERFPVYQLLCQVLKKKVARSITKIRTTGMQPSIALRLGLGKGEGLLQMERSSYDIRGIMLETSKFYIRPEVFAFVVETAGPFEVAPGIYPVKKV